MTGTGPEDVIAQLRWLADQPEGLAYRDLLFRAAWMLSRYRTTLFVPRPPVEERAGDQTI